METSTTVKFVLLFATLGSSNTVCPLPYQSNHIQPSMIAKYREIDLLKDNAKPYQKESNLYIIANVSKHLIENSKNIDNEFVEIVNNNFWDLF